MKKLLVTGILVLSSKLFAYEFSYCYGSDIPASPQGDILATLEIAEKDYVASSQDAATWQFWRNSCNRYGSTVTELFVTVTPKTQGKAKNVYTKFTILQNGYEHTEISMLYELNLYEPKSYSLMDDDDMTSIDLSKPFDLVLSCLVYDCTDTINVKIPSDGISTGGGTSTASINPTGLWYDPEMDGLGFNFILAPNGLFIYYYGYDSAGNPLWLTSDGAPSTLDIGQTYEVTVFEAKAGNGASFSQKPNAGQSLSQWGTVSVKLDSCATGVVILNGADGSKTFNVVKLASIKDLSCQ